MTKYQSSPVRTEGNGLLKMLEACKSDPLLTLQIDKRYLPSCKGKAFTILAPRNVRDIVARVSFQNFTSDSIPKNRSSILCCRRYFCAIGTPCDRCNNV